MGSVSRFGAAARSRARPEPPGASRGGADRDGSLVPVRPIVDRPGGPSKADPVRSGTPRPGVSTQSAFPSLNKSSAWQHLTFWEGSTKGFDDDQSARPGD